MANVNKIEYDGVSYDIEDVTARAGADSASAAAAAAQTAADSAASAAASAQIAAESVAYQISDKPVPTGKKWIDGRPIYVVAIYNAEGTVYTTWSTISSSVVYYPLVQIPLTVNFFQASISDRSYIFRGSCPFFADATGYHYTTPTTLQPGYPYYIFLEFVGAAS